MSDFADTAKGLFSLEINTVLKAGMSAQKMPDPADALVDLAQNYHVYLCQLTRDFGNPGQPLGTWERALSQSFGWGLEPYPQESEAMRIVLKDTEIKNETGQKILKKDYPVFGFDVSYNDRFLALPTHSIAADFETLRDVASWLREMRALTRRQAERARDEIRMISQGGIAIKLLSDDECEKMQACADKIDSEDDSVLFRIQRTSDQFKHLRTAGKAVTERSDNGLELDPQDLVKLRKAWDVGTEKVVMQTVIQIDGDVITRLVPSRAGAAHSRLHELHAGAVDVSFRHWETLVATVCNMAQSFFKTIIGAR